MLKEDSEDFKRVAKLLGRSPQGLEEVMCRDSSGMPSVIRVRCLVKRKPFPTLFWLVDKELCYVLAGLEARGVIQTIQEELNHDTSLQAIFQQDHRAYIDLRESYMSSATKAEVASLGYTALFKKRGIGGIENFLSVRCLHTYYAAHLIKPNALGALLDQRYLSVNRS